MNRGLKIQRPSIKDTRGFSLIEIMIGAAIGLVVLTAIYMTFSSQQDSYAVQTQTSATQQNLRAAVNRMTRDILMAGHYSNFVKEKFNFNMDLDLDGHNENINIRPLIFGVNNIPKNSTDVLIIIKADQVLKRRLTTGEGAFAGDPVTAKITLVDDWEPGKEARDLDGEKNDNDLPTGKYGILVRDDLSQADFFEVNNDEGDISPPGGLNYDYEAGDWIMRAEIIHYYIDDSDSDRPLLRRKDLGNPRDNQIVAENIENLQVRYHLSSGATKSNLAENEVPEVRAVEVALLGRTDKPIKGYSDTKTYTLAGDSFIPVGNERKYQRRLLSTTIQTRNIGL